MAKKSNAAKIRAYMAEYPDAKPADVAVKFNARPTYVYVLRSQMKREKNEKNFVSIDQQAQAVLNKPAPEPAPEPKATNVDATLQERGKRYGTFTGHAEVTYKLKNILREHSMRMNKTFTFDQAEAMDMICHKLGRIVNGDANYADSWVDIAGYAKLVADRLETGKEV